MKKLLICIFIAMIVLISYQIFTKKEIVNTFEIQFNNEIGYISVYNTNQKKVKQIENNIHILLDDYEKLIDRYNSYDGVKNLFYIRTNKDTNEYIELDPKLYNMIKIGLLWEKKSDGFFDIRYGNVIDIWNSYKNQESILPTTEEIEMAKQYSVLDVVLTENNQIKNNHPNLTLDDIKIAYIVDELASLLETSNIKSYAIHLANVIRVGEKYTSKPYKIGIESPENQSEITAVIEEENKSIVSIGNNKEFATYKDTLYHTFIPGTSLVPLTKKEAFSIVGTNAVETQIIAYMAYNSENKSEFLKKYPDFTLILY